MRRTIVIIWVFLFWMGCKEPLATHPPVLQGNYTLLTKSSFVAGEYIVLTFDGEPTDQLCLLLNNAWGATVLKAKKEEPLQFGLPDVFSLKSGVLEWKLLANSQMLATGQLEIQPGKGNKRMMETYLGPPSIFANGLDQSMIVALPQDSFGNPFDEGTPIQIRKQLQGNLQNKTLVIKHGIAYDYITADHQTGQYFISSQLGTQVSKEMVVNVMPSTPIDFEIEASREHNYADGNQLVTLSTSTVTDEHGNTVADGTLVSFHIETSEQPPIKTYGQTLNGIAKATILHPEKRDTWYITAYVLGSAESNMLELEFQSIISDLEIHFDPDKNELVIGPLKSYLGQLVPDGVAIEVAVLNDSGEILLVKQITSYEGMGKFLMPKTLDLKTYHFRVTAMGIIKEIKGL